MHTAEPTFWLPPRKLHRYQWAKVLTSMIATIIFTGWLTIQGSNPIMRTLALSLIAITLWVVIHSMRTDARNTRDRQISIDTDQQLGPHLCVTNPHRTTRMPIADIAHATWRHDNLQQAGLWLFDKQGKALTHLDLQCLSDESEARTFVGWVRRRTHATFPVQWPKTD